MTEMSHWPKYLSDKVTKMILWKKNSSKRIIYNLFWIEKFSNIDITLSFLH